MFLLNFWYILPMINLFVLFYFKNGASERARVSERERERDRERDYNNDNNNNTRILL